MCATCELKGTDTKLRIQSNGLPQQCYYSPDIEVVEQNIDFEVKFNWDVATHQQENISTVEEFDSMICDDKRLNHAKVPALAGFVHHGTDSLSGFGGVLFSGVPVSSVVGKDGVDPFNAPATWDDYSYSPVDQCGAYPNEDGNYESHFAPACYADETLESNVELISGEDTVPYVEAAYSRFGSQEPIGVAMDGHIIWGPLDSTGMAWNDCELDVCNGVFVDGWYGYASSYYFPYTVGCYGPGNYNTLSPTCSSLVRSCSQADLTKVINQGIITPLSGATFLELSALTISAVTLLSA